jgi:hypothetical protein
MMQPQSFAARSQFLFTYALTVIAFLVALPLASGQGELKLIASDGASSDNFGVSVAINGWIAIVGAHLDDDNGPTSGSAYLYNTTTGNQRAKLLASDGAQTDHFGFSVAISGGTAIVGAYRDGDNGGWSGSAYLFDTTTGNQIAKLLASDGHGADEFGYSVAISGGTAIVGAHYDGDNGYASGSAYLFDTTTGTQIAKLLPSDGAAWDWFGRSVAISGGTAIVGAHGDGDNDTSFGSAYLFDTATGNQIAKLLATDGAAWDTFGTSVAISGGTAIVGARYDGDNGSNSGSAYLFDTTTGNQIAKLLPSDGAADDRFGTSVAISGGTAIVGAVWDAPAGSQSGSAYLFDTTTGTQIAKLLASDGAAGDKFGNSVAISGGTAIVGAYGDDDNGSNSGSAYLFGDDCNGNGISDPDDIANCDGNLWCQDCNSNGILDECEIASDAALDCDLDGVLDTCQITSDPSLDCDDDGTLDSCEIANDAALDCDLDGALDSCQITSDPSLDCDGDGTLDSCQIASDPSLDQNTNGILDSCECVTANYCTTSPNTAGPGCTIGWQGSLELSSNNFTMTATGAPPLKFGVFFYGAAQAQIPLGEGSLCVGGQVQRLQPPVLTDQQGDTMLPIDFTMAPFNSGAFAVTPFSTWNFQFWFRDPLGGPAGFNFSDGLEVTFCP